ncbi:MAG: SDR family oxidoreductase [Hyphomonadaceae bacterium]
MTPHTLITGAASGIGRATARALAAQGHALGLIDQDETGLTSLLAELGADHHMAAMDVADPSAWAALDIDRPLTGAVICAGISEAALITDMRFEDWRKVMSVNLDGAFLGLQTALKHASDGASLVAVSSATGHKPAPMTAAYGASKAGLSQLVRTAALEAAPRRIRVNAVAPAGVKTPMFSDQPFFDALKTEHGSEAAAWAALGQSIPLGRYAEPDEVARMIAFLLGEDSATITGAILNCDGGYGL